MTPAERLIEWHQSWSLSGQIVTCRTCGCEQDEALAAENFVHTGDCLKDKPANVRPWAELEAIREGLCSPK